MNKVGDNNVSPYLLQRLRSLDEVEDEREKRQRGPDPKTESAAHTPAPAPTEGTTPKATDTTPTDARPGQRLDRSV